VWERLKINAKCGLQSMNRKANLEDAGIDGNVILKMDLQEIGWRMGGCLLKLSGS
jgi:hypothetical protein